MRPRAWMPSSNPIAAVVGDFNEDGRPDIATANYGNDTMAVLLGGNARTLLEDPTGSGLRSGFGRGNLSVASTDFDYWSFTANAGDRLTVAAENPGGASSSSLAYIIYAPDGTQLTSFTSDTFGRGPQMGMPDPTSRSCGKPVRRPAAPP